MSVASRQYVSLLHCAILAGDGLVRYEELIQFLKDCQASAKAAREPERFPEMDDVVRKVADYMKRNGRTAEQVFREFDLNGNGYIEGGRELTRLVTKMMPGLKREELRHVLAHMRAFDPDGDGRVSLADLKRAVGATSVKRVPERAGAAPYRVAGDAIHPVQQPLRSPAGADDTWELEEITIQGQTGRFLLERRTGRILASDRDGRPPRSVGVLVNGEVKMSSQTGRDFFEELDAYLKRERMQLRTVFDSSDLDRSGALDRNELNAMLRRVMPGASKGDVKYLEAQLDADGTSKSCEYHFSAF